MRHLTPTLALVAVLLGPSLSQAQFITPFFTPVSFGGSGFVARSGFGFAVGGRRFVAGGFVGQTAFASGGFVTPSFGLTTGFVGPPLLFPRPFFGPVVPVGGFVGPVGPVVPVGGFFGVGTPFFNPYGGFFGGTTIVVSAPAAPAPPPIIVVRERVIEREAQARRFIPEEDGDRIVIRPRQPGERPPVVVERPPVVVERPPELPRIFPELPEVARGKRPEKLPEGPANPRGGGMVRLGGPGQSLPVADPPLADPKQEQQRQIKLGLAAFAQNAFGTAASRFSRAIELHPATPEPHFLLAQAMFARGDYRDALAAIVTGLRHDPARPSRRFPLRELYSDPGLFVGQLADLRATLNRLPNDSALAFLYGYMVWFDGDRQEARRWLEHALRLTDDPEPIRLFLQVAPEQFAQHTR